MCFQKVPFFLLFLSILVCTCWHLFLFHVFFSPRTKWGKALPYLYNPVGFPSSKPAINPKHCYFFVAEGTFHTLHGGSSTTLSPSPFHCVQHALPFQSTQRWLTPPDTAAVPCHGFLRDFVSATSFRKGRRSSSLRQESSKPASPVWVHGAWRACGAACFKAKHSEMMMPQVLNFIFFRFYSASLCLGFILGDG